MKMQVSLGKPQPWVLPLTFVCLALGALIALMMRISTSELDLANARPEDLIAKIRNLQSTNNDLEDQNKKLRSEKDELLNSIASGRQNITEEMNTLRLRAGTTAVEGRGIVISIDDTTVTKPDIAALNDSAVLTHDVDLLMLVNELRAAGAEAIAINDQRVTAGTEIRCVGPVINVNKRQIGPPFVITAIGKPDDLAGAVNLPFGVLDQLKQLGIQASVMKRDKLHLPAISVTPPFEESKIVPEDKTGETKAP